MKAIVTGHTRGLGAALARELMQRGIPVLGMARGHAELPKLEQVALDLADSAALAAWLASGALAAFCAGADTVLLINNAGVVEPIGPSATQDLAAVGMAVALNVAAPLMLAAAVARLPGARRIVHVSSGAGRAPYAGWNIYCATKAALDQHARAVVLDGDPSLRICSLAPGIIDTAMQAAIRASSPALFPMQDKFIDLHRTGQLSDPATCAASLIDYLLSDAFGREPVADLRSIVGS